ncbi:MAG: DUF3035 domain-containing protein [Pseudomonadota bacterium]|nr:DUF3035 domain-containing protein [Pseudomonadota bacterium]
MRNSLALVVIAAAVLGGCASLRPKNAAADEFAVARNAPLVIPPDFSLTPPVAGTVTSSPQDAQSQAVEALFGGPAPRPQSETSLLEAAGRDSAAIGARSIAGDPNTNVVDLGATTRAIIAAPEANSDIASAQVP